LKKAEKDCTFFKNFCCLVGAILKILCQRERRVFQSKLGVASSNKYNIHHSQKSGNKKKKNKKRVESFSDTLYILLELLKYSHGKNVAASVWAEVTFNPT
jgi:hypothetical protein